MTRGRPPRSPGAGGAATRHAGAADGLATRRAALFALRAVERDGAWSNVAVPAAVAALPDARDRAFASHLAYDTMRWQGTLVWALDTVLTRPFEEVEPDLRRVLLLGALQLLRSGVPHRAAVDTCVSLAREQVPRARAGAAAGFVNGVLRALARRVEELPWPDPSADPVGHLQMTTAHPRWIVEDLCTRFDRNRVAAVLEADNRAPGVTLRAVGDRDALVDELREQGIDATPGSLPMAVRAPGADPRRLDAVARGRAVPQDEASMRVVLATGAREGDRVLDLCAGPGGKTTHLAQLVGPRGTVTAVELHPHRAELVREAAERQGLDVEVLVGDAADPPIDASRRFDVVLLDGPCTGLGTGRRRPEVRWRRTPRDVAALVELQDRLLAAAGARVAPGGSLTYAVCTWTAGETDGVADGFARRADDLGLVTGARRQLLPDVDDTDGMFHASWFRPDEQGRVPRSG